MAKPSSSLCQSISGSLQQEAAGSGRKQQEAAGHGETSRARDLPLSLCWSAQTGRWSALKNKAWQNTKKSFLQSQPVKKMWGGTYRTTNGDRFHGVVLVSVRSATRWAPTARVLTPKIQTITRSNVTFCNFLLHCFAVLLFVVLLPWVSSCFDLYEGEIWLNYPVVPRLLKGLYGMSFYR